LPDGLASGEDSRLSVAVVVVAVVVIGGLASPASPYFVFSQIFHCGGLPD
jgi:hypothetical protein